jgi:hypothetical protein
MDISGLKVGHLQEFSALFPDKNNNVLSVAPAGSEFNSCLIISF